MKLPSYFRPPILAAAWVCAASLVGCTWSPALQIAPPVVAATSGGYSAVGYATTESYKDQPPAQRRLLAIRAARLDAYRNLAEQLAGLRIRGGTQMSNAMVASDSYQSYVDALVRGAELKSITPKPGGVYQVEVELRTGPEPPDCLRAPAGLCTGGAAVTPLPTPPAGGGDYPQVHSSLE
jgi:outer membrane protein FlgP